VNTSHEFLNIFKEILKLKNEVESIVILICQGKRACHE